MSSPPLILLLWTSLSLAGLGPLAGLPNCPSLQLRQSLIVNPADNNLVCDCPKEGPGSGWEISCLKDPEDGNGSSGNSGHEFSGDYYYSIPIAFTVTYIEDKSITIHCYDDSHPNFKSAMFQGYGVDEVDTFKIFDCPLPSVPFNLIFHRTSITNNKERNNKRPLIGNNGNHISVTRSLRIDSSKPLKIDLKHFRHLFYGLDSLEHLSLKNVQLVYDEEASERVKRNVESNVVGNGSTLMTTPSSGYMQSNSSAINGAETTVSLPSHLTVIPPASTTSAKSETFGPAVASTVITSGSNNNNDSVDAAKEKMAVTEKTTSTNNTTTTTTTTTTATRERTMKTLSSNVPMITLPVSPKIGETNDSRQGNGSQRTKAGEAKHQKLDETKPSATRNEVRRTEIGNVTQAEKIPKSSGEVSDMVRETPERNSRDEGRAKEKMDTSSPSPPPVRTKINYTLGQLFPKLKSLSLESFLTQDAIENSYILKDFLPGLKFLENLDLRLNVIKILPNNTFESSGASLKRLYLLSNKIEIVEAGAFSKLTSLEILDLTKNYIRQVPKTMLNDLVNLKYLRMVQNWFKELPENLLTQATNLQAIDLNQNVNLTAFPLKFLNNLYNLKNFSICDCNLTHLTSNPSQFFRLTPNLEKLEMRGNKFANLTAPGLFAQNSKLNKIDLSYNDITLITPDVFSENSSSLSELHLYGNNLTTLNEEIFFNLRNLRRLNLGFNNLNEINLKIFHQLANLEELNLSSNNLSSINSEKSELPFGIGKQLRRINLSRNNLQDFSEFEVINWTLYLQLEVMDLSYNAIQGEIDIPVFYATADVDLDLSHNQINSVTLRSITLHEQLLLDESRSEKSQLNEYRRSNTKLNRVTVYIRHNPLICDCWLVPFIKYARSSSEPMHRGIINKVTFDIDSPELMCAKPASLEKQTLADVKLTELTCLLEDKEYCPSDCHCAFRSSDESVIVNCERRGLKRIPDETIALCGADTIHLSMSRTVSEVAGVVFRFEHNYIKDLMPLRSLLNSNGTKAVKRRRRKSMYLDFYMDDNGIKDIPEDLFVISDKNQSSQATEATYIRVLSLRNNHISWIPDSFMDYFAKRSKTKVKREIEIYLGHNPYNCTPLSNWKNSSDCVMRKFKSWLTNNYRLILDIQDITCESLDFNSTSIITRIPDNVLCPHLYKADRTLVFSLIVLIGVLFLLLLLMTVLYYRNKQTVLAYVYIHFQPIFICFNFSEDDLDEDKVYDAFVSYSSADRDIVMQLIENLEKPSPESHVSISYLESQIGMPTVHEGRSDRIVPEPNSPIKNSKVKNGLAIGDDEDDEQMYFKLCIHERDWLPGNLISWNIVNSVQNSRRTILILSNEFIKSIWFQVEFHTAYYQMLEDKMDRLIVIVKGELPPKEELDKDLVFLLTTKTYLVWGEKWFWEKLRYALPHKKKALKKDPNLNFSTYETPRKKGQTKADAMKTYVEETIANHFQLHTPSNLSQKKEKATENLYAPNPVIEKYQNPEKKDQNKEADKGVVNESFVVETET